MLGLTTTTDAEDLPDEEVLRLSITKPWLFGILVDRYESAFMRKAMGIVRNKNDAEEKFNEITRTWKSIVTCIFGTHDTSSQHGMLGADDDFSAGFDHPIKHSHLYFG